MNLTKEQIASDRKLCEAATAGPWEITTYSNYIGYSISAGVYGCLAERWYKDSLTEERELQMKANASLIIRSRTSLPQYIAALEESQAECEELGRVIVGYKEKVHLAESQNATLREALNKILLPFMGRDSADHELALKEEIAKQALSSSGTDTARKLAAAVLMEKALIWALEQDSKSEHGSILAYDDNDKDIIDEALAAYRAATEGGV